MDVARLLPIHPFLRGMLNQRRVSAEVLAGVAAKQGDEVPDFWRGDVYGKGNSGNKVYAQATQYALQSCQDEPATDAGLKVQQLVNIKG